MWAEYQARLKRESRREKIRTAADMAIEAVIVFLAGAVFYMALIIAFSV